MAKATDTQIKNVQDALAQGGKLPEGVRINFGDPEPIQKVAVDKSPAEDAPASASTDKK